MGKYYHPNVNSPLIKPLTVYYISIIIAIFLTYSEKESPAPKTAQG